MRQDTIMEIRQENPTDGKRPSVVIKCFKKVGRSCERLDWKWTTTWPRHALTLGEGGGSHHSASLCSTSLRKPVWNLCRGSKVEKMVFFRDSGVASSSPTAFWKDWDHKCTHESEVECVTVYTEAYRNNLLWAITVVRLLSIDEKSKTLLTVQSLILSTWCVMSSRCVIFMFMNVYIWTND